MTMKQRVYTDAVGDVNVDVSCRRASVDTGEVYRRQAEQVGYVLVQLTTRQLVQEYRIVN